MRLVSCWMIGSCGDSRTPTASELINGRKVWEMIQLGYRPPDYDARPKIPGKIRLLKFKNFCPYKIVKVPERADTRDTAAIKRIATAYLKVLFPNVRRTEDVDKKFFSRYCLERACQMRATIRQQLALLDIEYAGKNIPTFEVI